MRWASSPRGRSKPLAAAAGLWLAVFREPLIAPFLGVAMAAEPLTWAEWIALGVLPAGVFLIFRGKTRRKPE